MKLKPAGCPVTCGDPSPCIVAAAEEEKKTKTRKINENFEILCATLRVVSPVGVA